MKGLAAVARSSGRRNASGLVSGADLPKGGGSATLMPWSGLSILSSVGWSALHDVTAHRR